jgi:hypothetical protein
VALGIPWWLGLGVSLVVLYGVLRWWGRKTDMPATERLAGGMSIR